jgi:hypothetical protein
VVNKTAESDTGGMVNDCAGVVKVSVLESTLAILEQEEIKTIVDTATIPYPKARLSFMANFLYEVKDIVGLQQIMFWNLP